MMKVKETPLPIDWDEIKPFELKYALWNTEYTPYTWAKLVYKKDQALYINMFVEELNPKAIYKHANEPVYKDSCLECFLNVNPGHTNKYINFEVNANAVMLMGIGPERYVRENLVPNFKPIVYKNEKGWGYILKVPADFLKYHFGDIADEWIGNFFKCGDDCEYEHYLSWSFVDDVNPNFHKVDCFGRIKLN